MSQGVPVPTKILRKRAVVARVGLSSTTIWRLERKELFPKHVKLTANTVGWREADIEAWLADRAARPDAFSARDYLPAPVKPAKTAEVS